MKQLSIFENEKNESCNIVNWILFIDGASRSNPGQASVGIYLKNNDQDVIKKGFYIGCKTNNQAEYIALLIGLTLAKEFVNPKDNLTIKSDSELLVKQINKQYKVKNEEIAKLYKIANDLLNQFNFCLQHIPRSENKVADKLANEAIDKKIAIDSKILEALKIQI